MNRVTTNIAKTEAQIAERVTAGLVTQAKLDTLHKTLNMELGEYVQFQEAKSIASTDGELTLDEAMTIYGYLGNTVEHFNAQPLAVKVVLTKIWQELLERRIKSR